VLHKNPYHQKPYKSPNFKSAACAFVATALASSATARASPSLLFHLDHFMNYESIFNYVMYSSNSSNNSFESSYDPRVASFHSLSDPLPIYEFHNIDVDAPTKREPSLLSPNLCNIILSSPFSYPAPNTHDSHTLLLHSLLAT